MQKKLTVLTGLFLGLAYFLSTQAAEEPMRPTQPTKEVTVAATPDLSEQRKYTIHFFVIESGAKSHRISKIECRPNMLLTTHLPIQNIEVMATYGELDNFTSHLILSPADVAKLSIITIDNNGILKAVYTESAPIAPVRAPSPIKTKDVPITTSPDFSGDTEFLILYPDASTGQAEFIHVSRGYKSAAARLSLDGVRIVSYVENGPFRSELILIPDEIKKLASITIDNNGQLKAQFAEPSAPVAPTHAPSSIKTKKIILTTPPGFNNSYKIEFKDNKNKKVVENVHLIPGSVQLDKQLPIQDIRIIVLEKKTMMRENKPIDINMVLSEQRLTAAAVAKLAVIKVYEDGHIETEFEGPSEAPAANIQAPSPLRLKTVKIIPSVDFIWPKNYVIIFLDKSYNKTAEGIMPKRNKSESVQLPIQDIFVASRHDGSLTSDLLKLSAAEVEKLSSITFGNNGQLIPTFEKPASPAPSKPLPPVPQSHPIISQLFGQADHSDIEGFRKLLPEIKTMGIIDQPDPRGITALGHAIIQLRNNLELIHELTANGADIMRKDHESRPQIELAGAQKDAVMKLLGITVTAECPVCLEPKQLVKLPLCRHELCIECLKGILQKPLEQQICPLCRAPIQSPAAQ